MVMQAQTGNWASLQSDPNSTNLRTSLARPYDLRIGWPWKCNILPVCRRRLIDHPKSQLCFILIQSPIHTEWEE